eukprot:TRINITY_DN1375_c0_g1_i1.p1 TRINITY_DN1375_c0_g1~~TRINITY_DN1375_c0_g1_i1.p1  ORF type:complete len:461 (+),score=94.37 TRINITY_DN1375_c0_g1_i1:73-1383(+)
MTSTDSTTPTDPKDQMTPGGFYECQRVCYVASAGLTLLDLRVPIKGEHVRNSRRLPTETAPSGDEEMMFRMKKGGLGERFVTKAHGTIVECFQNFGYDLGVYLDGDVLCATLLATADKKPITEQTAQHLSKLLEKTACDLPSYRWNDLIQNLVSESKELIESLRTCSDDQQPDDSEWERGVRNNLDKELAKKITAEAIIPCGLPNMEIGFAAGGSQILFPTPENFTDDHWKLWNEVSPYAGSRGVLDFVYSAAIWLPHEVLHCIQDGALKATGAASDTSLHNWQCEYCVCFGQSLFFASIIAENRKKKGCRSLMLPSHYLEESLLWLEACQLSRRSSMKEVGTKWTTGRAQELPFDQQPYEFMEERYPEYLALLTTVVLEKFSQWQALVEIDEQQTSYWAEFVKYVNKMLETTAPDKIPEVADTLTVGGNSKPLAA